MLRRQAWRKQGKGRAFPTWPVPGGRRPDSKVGRGIGQAEEKLPQLVHLLYTETKYFTRVISLNCPTTILCPCRYDKMSETFCDLCTVSKNTFLIVVEIGQYQIKAPKGLMRASKLSLLPIWHPERGFFWGGEVGSEGQYCVFTQQKIHVLVTLGVVNKYLKKSTSGRKDLFVAHGLRGSHSIMAEKSWHQ